MNDPLLIPQSAREAGTVGKIDRSAQYDPQKYPDVARPEKLVEAVNAQGNHIRGLQSESSRMQRQLLNLQLRNAIIVAALTGAIARAPEIIAFLKGLLH